MAAESISSAVGSSLAGSPIVGVVRTHSRDEAAEQAHAFLAGGIQLVEVTFTVPSATELVAELVAARAAFGPPWIGMGTVTGRRRAEQAIAAGAEFLISPNVSADVADVANAHQRFLVIGALTPSEIVAARDLGADIVKVYPLPPVGGANYLATVRQPLGDIPMLAAGGFGVDEIPAYRAAGASAFGIGSPLIGTDAAATSERIRRALDLARGNEDL